MLSRSVPGMVSPAPALHTRWGDACTERPHVPQAALKSRSRTLKQRSCTLKWRFSTPKRSSCTLKWRFSTLKQSSCTLKWRFSTLKRSSCTLKGSSSAQTPEYLHVRTLHCACASWQLAPRLARLLVRLAAGVALHTGGRRRRCGHRPGAAACTCWVGTWTTDAHAGMHAHINPWSRGERPQGIRTCDASACRC